MENTKSELRNLIRKGRSGAKANFDFKLLTTSPEFKVAEFIASYRSYGDEPDTKELNKLIIAEGKALLLPVLKPDHSLAFSLWDGETASLKLNGKVEEPIGGEFSGGIDLMILPALAIDAKGNRLGQGGGSYDRALTNFSGFSIAIINEDELVEVLPTEITDRKVSAALTPSKLVRF